MKTIKSFLIGAILSLGFISTAQATLPTLQFPLPGLPDTWRISSSIGEHWENQYCSGRRQLHTATDFVAPVGTRVGSVYAGTVVAVVIYNNNPYHQSNFVTISHQSGAWTTTYHHIRPFVSPGNSVSMNTKIGEVNSHSNGSHLHFGVRVAPYSNTANRGRLPEGAACGGDPAFPNYFVDGADLNYYW